MSAVYPHPEFLPAERVDHDRAHRGKPPAVSGQPRSRGMFTLTDVQREQYQKLTRPGPDRFKRDEALRMIGRPDLIREARK